MYYGCGSLAAPPFPDRKVDRTHWCKRYCAGWQEDMADPREAEITAFSTRSASLASSSAAASGIVDSQMSTTSPSTTPNGAHRNKDERAAEPLPYIDLLLLGKTGMGKSTTGDKLLAADPYNVNYIGKQQAPEKEEVVKESNENRQFSCDDITLWKLSSDGDYKKAKERIKRIVFQRSIEGENIYDPEREDVESVTKDCELLANETSRIRVLDVPGFFGSDTIALAQADAPIGLNPLEEGACNVQQANLGVMRQILRIQAEKGLIFRRILYFLPTRGPPDRADAALQSELRVMKYFFGRAIFECMVIVATMPSSVSKKGVFSSRDVAKTKRVVSLALERTFNPQMGSDSTEQHTKPPDPPIIYVSLEETGMEIYNKLLSHDVEQKDGLQLKFDEDACARCALKVGYFMKEKIVCIMDDNGVQKRMVYDESKCHPLIKPKYSRLKKVMGGIAYIVLLGIPKLAGANWPGFFNGDEECADCKKPPGSEGCMRVGQFSDTIGKEVDHSSELDRIEIVQEKDINQT